MNPEATTSTQPQLVPQEHQEAYNTLQNSLEHLCENYLYNNTLPVDVYNTEFAIYHPNPVDENNIGDEIDSNVPEDDTGFGFGVVGEKV